MGTDPTVKHLKRYRRYEAGESKGLKVCSYWDDGQEETIVEIEFADTKDVLLISFVGMGPVSSVYYARKNENGEFEPG